MGFLRQSGVAGLVVSAVLLSTRVTTAQSAEELASARKWFNEALADESQGKCDVALEKLLKVKAVKDTAPVRYRIASCLEALGRLKEAAQSYDEAVTKADRTQQDVAAAAKDRASAVRKKLAYITLQPDDPSSGALVVRLDGEQVPASSFGTPTGVNPGKHTVDADVDGAPRFHADLVVDAMSSRTVRIATSVAPRSGTTSEPSPVLPPNVESPGDRSRRILGWSAVGVGGAFVLTAGVLLLVRDRDIIAIESRCPSNVCPLSSKDDVTGIRNRALVEGPLAVTFGVLGLAAAGTGAYLLLAPPPKSKPQTSFTVSPTTGGLAASFGGHF